ncbi:mitochondrial import protein Pam17-domain-containing protein [Kickxella alabastrina]|uniref:mitochondrial import protein Pam17-domain-containing protein n=1 Tax=Kickxella alabastrina TaxID=61397 RepID=UPI0022205E61|nr:mitochondrial import protein Pam17-domain-containing protein [Kickxella alabastrina]KAI7820597.1 mitochondrial import protein Pam17-domain-containing protein [Kickxella alabastrina]
MIIGTFTTSASQSLARVSKTLLSRPLPAYRLSSFHTTTAFRKTASSNEVKLNLDWDGFFKMRRQRRLWERLAALPCAMLGLGAGAAVFASLPINPQQTFMGLDPLIVFSGATIFCGVLGFVVGPSVGRVWYRIGNGEMARAIDAKEAEFFKHVRANRSDPNFSSASNPLPDFYGEKINSLSGYRQWLRKQREHERKGTFKLGSAKRK